MTFDFNSGFVASFEIGMERIPGIVSFLTMTNTQYPGGSSFALTSELHHPHKMMMYVTQSSLDRLTQAKMRMPKAVCRKCGTAECLEDADSGWYDDE